MVVPSEFWLFVPYDMISRYPPVGSTNFARSFVPTFFLIAPTKCDLMAENLIVSVADAFATFCGADGPVVVGAFAGAGGAVPPPLHAASHAAGGEEQREREACHGNLHEGD
jgi:hypothetical protein